MKSKADWVVHNCITGRFECQRCGESYAMKLPAPLEVFAAAGLAFLRLHRGCPPKGKK